MTTAVLVATGVVVVCCGAHRPGGCCDDVECAPCCPECPICAEVQSTAPAERAAEAARHRVLVGYLAEWARVVNRDLPRWEAPACPIN